MQAVANRMAGYFGIAFFGVLPFVHSMRLLDPVRYPQWAAFCLGMFPLLVSWVWKMRTDPPAPGKGQQPGAGAGKFPLAPPASKVWWLALPLAFLTLSSMAWALNASEAWFTFIHLSLCLVFLYVSRGMVARVPNLLEAVVKVLIVSMSLLAFVGILQKLGEDPLGTSDQFRTPNATMANPNFLGDALALGLPFCIYGLLRLRSLPWRIGAGMANALILAGIVASGGRSSMVPLLLTAIFFPPVIIWRRFKDKWRWLLLFTWVVAFALLLWTSKFFFRNKENTYNIHYIWESGHVIGPKTSSIEHRFILWHHTLYMALERPVTGVGAGNWKLEIQRFGVSGFDDQGNYGMRVPLQPHNEYFGVLAELGFPGLLLVAGIGLMGISGAWRMTFSGKDPILGACLLMAWLIFFIDAGFSFPMERPFQSLMLFWILALSLSGGVEKTNPAAAAGHNKRIWVRRIGWGLSAVALILGSATLVGRIQSDAAMKELRDQKDAHQPQRMLKTALQAQNWTTQLDAASAMPVDWYVGMAHQEMGQLEAAVAAFERALQVAPHQHALKSGYASLLDMTGRHQAAATVLGELLTVFPDDPEGWLNLSIMHIHAQDSSAARRALSRVPAGHSPEKVQLVDQTLRAAGH
jgi:O-antigen ligase